MLDVVPVMPVVVLDSLDHAVPVARALVAGGLPAIELTLRTPVALDAIRAIASEVPEILIGAGTITTPAQPRRRSTPNDRASARTGRHAGDGTGRSAVARTFALATFV